MITISIYQNPQLNVFVLQNVKCWRKTAITATPGTKNIIHIVASSIPNIVPLIA